MKSVRLFKFLDLKFWSDSHIKGDVGEKTGIINERITVLFVFA